MSYRHQRPRQPLAISLMLMSLGLILAALAGCQSTPEAANKPAQDKPAAPPALVRVAPVSQGALKLERAYFAQTQPLERAQLAAGATGEVKSVQVRVGARVKRGDVLVEVDRDLANTQVAQVQASRQQLLAQREQLERDAARIEGLGAELAPQVEAERLRAQIKAIDAQLMQTQASLRGAQEQLRRHRVLAPFDGVIASRQINPGDWVNPGTAALEIVSDEGVEALVNASPDLLDRVAIGDKAKLKRGEHEIEAQVVGLVPELSPRTRTVTLRLLPQEQASWLMPGQVVDAIFTLEIKDEQAWLIPFDAVIEGGAGARTLVVREGKAFAIDLRILEKTASQVLALTTQAPLQSGDQAIIRGNERVRPGQPVQLQTPAGATKTP